jgi:excisionase family DNA binding protein
MLNSDAPQEDDISRHDGCPLLIGGCPMASGNPSRAADAGGDVIDIAEAAAFLATTVRHMRYLVYTRSIPYNKVGKYVRFSRKELRLWLQERRHQPR